MVRRYGACILDCSVGGGDGSSELSGEGPGLECVESPVEMLYLRKSKDHPITILSIQDAMERRPSHRSGMSADTMLLSGISNCGH